PVQADNRNVLQQDAVGFDLGNRSSSEADDQQSSFPGDAFGREIRNVAAHRIVDDISTVTSGDLLDAVHPSAIPIVDGVFGALRFAKRQFLVAACGGNDSCSSAKNRFADLHGGTAHASRSSMHQEPFAGAQRGAMFQSEVGGL